MNRFVRAGAVLWLVPLAACAYGPNFRRESEASSPPWTRGPNVPFHLAVESASSGACARRLQDRLADALRSDRRVSAVVVSGRSTLPVDATVIVAIDREARTTQLNFAVAWPGFLVNAPYWHGFEWPYAVKTHVRVVGRRGETLYEGEVDARYVALYTPASWSVPLALAGPFGSAPAFALGCHAAQLRKPPNLASIDRAFAKEEGPFWARRLSDRILFEIERALPATGERPD